uniref:Uncharacterized protein n=1 Tax=Rhizophora mucronata TaxID=61149 RepID=A0A2P2NA08_RHIMU
MQGTGGKKFLNFTHFFIQLYDN